MAEREGEIDTMRDARTSTGLHDVVVSIINYRTAERTIACAESVLAAPDALDIRVVVVDNASGDGSADAIAVWREGRADKARVTLVRSPTNSGFSGGHNQGIGAERGRAYLLLNSDALVRPGAIAALFEALEARPDIGLIAPRLEYEDGEAQLSCFRFPNPLSELVRGAALTWLRRRLARYDTPLSTDPDPSEIEWVSFACVMLRGAMVDRLGPMDEGYFMYFEDAEYCLRAREAGWRTAYLPEARAVHFRGGSAPVKRLHAERKRLPAYYYASRARFLRRAHGWGGLLAANLLWTAGWAACFGKAAVRLRLPRRVAREHVDIWINFLAPNGDRRAPEA